MTQKYYGMPYPITKTSKGLFAHGGDSQQIKSSLLSIILTLPTERVMEPRFGTPLNRLDLRQPQQLVEEHARRMIAESIALWEKRVQVQQVQTLLRYDEAWFLWISVSYLEPDKMQQVQELTLETPLGV